MFLGVPLWQFPPELCCSSWQALPKASRGPCGIGTTFGVMQLRHNTKAASHAQKSTLELATCSSFFDLTKEHSLHRGPDKKGPGRQPGISSALASTNANRVCRASHHFIQAYTQPNALGRNLTLVILTPPTLRQTTCRRCVCGLRGLTPAPQKLAYHGCYAVYCSIWPTFSSCSARILTLIVLPPLPSQPNTNTHSAKTTQPSAPCPLSYPSPTFPSPPPLPPCPSPPLCPPPPFLPIQSVPSPCPRQSRRRRRRQSPLRP